MHTFEATLDQVARMAHTLVEYVASGTTLDRRDFDYQTFMFCNILAT